MQAPFDIAADLDTPVSAYLKLKQFEPRFLLESVEGGERLARYSFLGFGPWPSLVLHAAQLVIDGAPRPSRRVAGLGLSTDTANPAPRPECGQ